MKSHEISKFLFNRDCPLAESARANQSSLPMEWKALDALVDERLIKEAPSLSRVTETLSLIDRAISSLLSSSNLPKVSCRRNGRWQS